MIGIAVVGGLYGRAAFRRLHPDAPMVLLRPDLVGQGAVGTVLSMDPGQWSGSPAPDLSLQWQRDGLPLPGQSAPAYEIQPEDAGAVLSVCVVAQNAAGTSQACSPLMPVWPNQTVSAWYTRRINPSSMTIQRAPGVSALPNVAGGAQIELT